MNFTFLLALVLLALTVGAQSRGGGGGGGRGGGRGGGGSGSRRTGTNRNTNTGRNSNRTTGGTSRTRTSTNTRSNTRSRTSSTLRKVALVGAVAGVTKALGVRRSRRRRRGGDDAGDSEDYVEIEANFNNIDDATIYTMDVDNDIAPTLCMFHYDDDDDLDDSGDNAALSYCVVLHQFNDILFDDLRWSNIDVDELNEGGVDFVRATATASGAANVTLDLIVPSSTLSALLGDDSDAEDNQVLANAARYNITINGVAGNTATLTKVVYTSVGAEFNAEISQLTLSGSDGIALVWPESSGGADITAETVGEPSNVNVASGYRRGGSTAIRYNFDNVNGQVSFGSDMQVEPEALGLEDTRTGAVASGADSTNPISILSSVAALSVALIALVL